MKLIDGRGLGKAKMESAFKSISEGGISRLEREGNSGRGSFRKGVTSIKAGGSPISAACGGG